MMLRSLEVGLKKDRHLVSKVSPAESDSGEESRKLDR